MPRTRVVLVVLGALLAGAVATLPAAAQLSYGNVEQGEIESQCLGLCFSDVANCDVAGTIDSLDILPPFYVRGLRTADADDNFCANAPGVTQKAILPVTLQPGRILVVDLDMVADEPGSFDRDFFVNGDKLTEAQVNVAPAGPCPPSATNLLCLEDERFTVRSFWRTQFGTRGTAPAVVGVASDDSGLLYFFNPNNWELLIKVLDGCGTNNHFWVFSAATTNVEFTLTVTDTEEKIVRTYFNPLGTAAAPIQDTAAFATCP